MPPGPPLGVGGVPFESVEFVLPEASVLAMYTDGLVERRGRDLDEGITLLRQSLAPRDRPLEEACDAVLAALVPGGAEDDVALIMARTVSPGRGQGRDAGAVRRPPHGRPGPQLHPRQAPAPGAWARAPTWPNSWSASW